MKDTHLDYLKTHNVVYVIEEIPNYIQSLYKIIKPDGFTILSVPNKYPSLESLHWYRELY